MRESGKLSFALPDGVSNDSRLLLSVSYVVRFHSTFYDVARWGLVSLYFCDWCWRGSGSVATSVPPMA